MNIVENNDKIEVLGPMVPSVMFCHYVWNQGFTMRLLPLPFADTDMFFRWVRENELGEPLMTPMMFVFTAQFKTKPGSVFYYSTVDEQEASNILGDPKRIRMLHDEVAPLIPVDPVTGDVGMSVKEYNQWATQLGKAPDGFNVPNVDYSALNNVNLDEFTDMLREAADTSNKKENDND